MSRTSRQAVTRVRVERIRGMVSSTFRQADGHTFALTFRPCMPGDCVHVGLAIGSPAGGWASVMMAGGGA